GRIWRSSASNMKKRCKCCGRNCIDWTRTAANREHPKARPVKPSANGKPPRNRLESARCSCISCSFYWPWGSSCSASLRLTWPRRGEAKGARKASWRQVSNLPGPGKLETCRHHTLSTFDCSQPQSFGRTDQTAKRAAHAVQRLGEPWQRGSHPQALCRADAHA